jgi:hypothetical protein
MKNVLTEVQYFGCTAYVQQWLQYDKVLFSVNDAYTKMTFRNRCIVAGSNGLINLSVPLETGRNTRVAEKDVRISNRDNWQQQHWRTLYSCYGKAPYWEYYADWLQAFYEKQFVLLSDMNFEIALWLKKVLKIPAELAFARPEDVAGATDARNLWLPRNYRTQPNPLQYRQLFEHKLPFEPNLCVLDALLCAGPGIIKG